MLPVIILGLFTVVLQRRLKAQVGRVCKGAWLKRTWLSACQYPGVLAGGSGGGTLYRTHLGVVVVNGPLQECLGCCPV
jgi:hypothetical protein